MVRVLASAVYKETWAWMLAMKMHVSLMEHKVESSTELEQFSEQLQMVLEETS